ncbi:hypothetical protein E2C01_002716 [Portunus trituberculatus]|uniref:Uncharacterized protein n=1 Tax=Portunus trituberculatus TaxID=210409 RepID=A0A5B7CLZ4_PORTR|nr:hypothetical protein [Portunus trituberculatus]
MRQRGVAADLLHPVETEGPTPIPSRPPPPNAQPPTTPRQSSHIHGAVLLLAAQHYGEEINTRRGSRAELAAGTTV